MSTSYEWTWRQDQKHSHYNIKKINDLQKRTLTRKYPNDEYWVLFVMLWGWRLGLTYSVIVVSEDVSQYFVHALMPALVPLGTIYGQAMVYIEHKNAFYIYVSVYTTRRSCDWADVVSNYWCIYVSNECSCPTNHFSLQIRSLLYHSLYTLTGVRVGISRSESWPLQPWSVCATLFQHMMFLLVSRE